MKTKTLWFLLPRSSVYIIGFILLFLFIATMTAIKPAYRLSSEMISEWTSDIDSSFFYYLLRLENRAFHEGFPADKAKPDVTNTLFQIATNLKPNDPRSLLRNEIPGFSNFDNQMIVAGQGTDFTNFPVESSPPLEDVLKERQAVLEESEEQTEKDKKDQEQQQATPTTGDKQVVYIYNSHNRESFLPHLPEVTDPNQAHHKEVNITKVSDRLAKSLQDNGIGTVVEDTDIMNELNKKGWDYGKSYQASRQVVEDAFAANKHMRYAFDLHRDSISRDKTTTKINGKSYARLMIVVGAEHADYEENQKLATNLHYLLEEKYPGLSRGVYTKKGAGTNGIFNQDLSENALLFEFGGVENHLDELYRSADALADVFSEMYWDAEKVDASS
ncbi:stage II sporulation protein P [Virgibacillus pantothenticus]|uniref:Stage II sporulation protein P n=1 Tax=Virgibacillus pantothenticus TaxID=1473 RepID=A0A0L0QPQ5_VIRPA|nr:MULTISPECIES: stage II sporulation protein P [Virgibacillus]API90589.1 stage II sporulation protein P [Virgibacillus sp. 6R]KNE20544.1 stage II sporulation protein P [Virgibacillus pantothenticus]MBS7429704.1 stage II sporulation protein P [Virgibacillus sp. 19R1-5]MBU8565579.1 stage II sporulation protein P [Virgibacillus pantothenticus]MBU8599877.1 stage II sporulation protein P [Virgibacillus pantothenticus]